MKDTVKKTMTLAAAALCAASAAAADLKPKALVIMLDGMRADAVENAVAPNLQMLRDGKWQPGYGCSWSLTANTILDAGTISGPNHIAIACGITFKKHNVPGNGKNVCDHRKWPSWLVRLVEAKPETKALFMYSWKWDESISPDPRVKFIHGTDAANYAAMPKILAAPDAPDAVQWYIDEPDHGGHGFGYYPYAHGYLYAVHSADRAIGAALKAIASRPTFAQEDWLVIVTADHGGYHTGHGMMNGPATTIPLLVCGRNFPQGRLVGTPHNFQSAATALRHFGVDASGMDLDGAAIEPNVARDAPRALGDALAVYLPFSGGKAANAVAGGPVAEICGTATQVVGRKGFCEGTLHVAADTNKLCGVCLKGSERLKFENGSDFALAMWVRMPDKQAGDPVVASNKDWVRGSNPGIALVASKTMGKKYGPGVCFNTGLPNGRRNDLGVYDIEYGKWTFYAATCGSDGVLRFYQGGPDGYLYMMSENVSGMKVATGLPFYIGQDGTGRYSCGFKGDIDEFALWTRTLGHDDVRRIYEAGRKGIPLGDLLSGK
ncbi:MAG: alkaline phosphatase family protein [Kiritimatiellae bacterium]|nr:alkaline phosphatase family protein [Kiritimatiellia bacterium]